MTETFAEKQARIRRESAQRIRLLFAIAIFSVVARMVISDPVKPPPPDHSGVPIKLMPGMLESLPPSERAKLDPVLIARMMAIDEEARLNKGRLQKDRTEIAYRATARPQEDDLLGEREKKRSFEVARRIKASDLVRAKLREQADAPKKTLVRFSKGGSLRVEDARRVPGGLTIRLAGVAATFPDKLIGSISTNSSDWQEPLPAGMVRLLPARGITITVSRDSAERITISKPAHEQI